MRTNDEINREIHTRLMKQDGDPPDYAGSFALSLQVLGYMVHYGFYYALGYHEGVKDDGRTLGPVHLCEFWNKENGRFEGRTVADRADELPRCICLAALRALDEGVLIIDGRNKTYSTDFFAWVSG